MIIYLIIICITILLVFLLNYFIAIPICMYDYTLSELIGKVGMSIIVVFLIDAFLAFLIRRLPKKWFNFKYRFFHIFKSEKKFYEKIKIKKWKDLIPELGQFTNFSKRKVDDPTNNEYIERFLLEVCYGEVIHFSSILFGFLIVFLYDLRFCWCIGIPIAIANALINYLSLAILRYNRPKLTTLYKRNSRLESRRHQRDMETETKVTE